MEQLLVQLAMALIQIVPGIIDHIQKSTGISEEEKKKLLFDLNVRLTEATSKVQSVRFKEVP